jgi:N-acetylmuramoyl-L-alanine amidase
VRWPGFCRFGLIAIAATVASTTGAAEPDAPRVAPSRPGATPPTPTPATAPAPHAPKSSTPTKAGAVSYLPLSSVAQHLGLKLSWVEPGHKAVLSAPGARAEFEADTRDIMVNGLRVFLGEPVLSAGHELKVSRVDFERSLAPMLRPGFATDAPPPPKIIALDPGHGGADIGAPNPRVGIVEKAVTLDVAFRLKKLLEADGYQVVMTRTEDKLPAPKSADLATRAEIANRAHADLFVSIHFNVVERDAQRTRGVEVYTFPPAGQHSTDWWSEMQKDDPHFLATQEPGNRFDHWNVVLAQAVHRDLIQTLKAEDRGKKLMHLGVLRSLNCPGILVEPAVMSNDVEARKLTTAEFKDKIAEALRDGIRDYVTTIETVRARRAKPTATSRRHPSSRSS